MPVLNITPEEYMTMKAVVIDDDKEVTTVDF